MEFTAKAQKREGDLDEDPPPLIFSWRDHDMLIRRNSYTVATQIDENEIIVFHLKNGEYYGLEGIHKEVWILINDSCCEKSLILAELCSKFDNEAEQIKRMLDNCIDQLLEKDLITIDFQ